MCKAVAGEKPGKEGENVREFSSLVCQWRDIEVF